MFEKAISKNELSYEEARAYLDSLQFHKIKLGLAPMREFHAKLGNPEEKLKIVHVAGTNGKGSVCSALVSVLSQAGYRVGIYTSPHLSSPRERFRINEDYISKEDFARITSFIQDTLAGRPITYFEFTTSLALLWFYEQGVDLVVLETGLGGRLDATNIVSAPLVCVITSISMDHEAYLGNTVESIASEKAGIIKAGVPVVVATDDSRAIGVLEAFAEKLHAPLLLRGRDFIESWQGNNSFDYRAVHPLLGGLEYKDIKNPKPGRIGAENASAVLATLKLLESYDFTASIEQIYGGLSAVRWPGRQELLERGGRRFLLDGAHNPAGVAALADVLKLYSYKKLYCIWGAMADKDIASGLSSILDACEELLLVHVDSERAASPEKMLGLLGDNGSDRAKTFGSASLALDYAQEKVEGDDLILVIGSLYLIGEVRPLLVGGLV